MPTRCSAFRDLLARVGLIRPQSTFDRVRPALWVALGAILGVSLIVVPLMISGADATATMGITTSTTGSMITVEGTTDLPDGAIVVVQLVQADEWDRESADGVAPDVATSPWIRSDDATVRNGRFTASIDVDVWPAGRGRAAAYFWIDGMQPADVVERFGLDGSDLRGPDVVDLDGFGPTLTVEDAFVIAD